MKYLTAQPGDIRLCHPQSCLEDPASIEHVPYREKLHHVLLVQKLHHLVFSKIFQPLHIILLSKLQENRGFLLDYALFKLPSAQ